LSDPAVAATMHLADVSIDSPGQILRMKVHLKNGEDLRKQFLLMEVVKLKSGVHSVDNGMLMHKSGELSNDLCNQVLRVREVIHDMGARNDMVSLVHAVVESGNTVDVVDFVYGDSSVDSSNMSYFLGMTNFFFVHIGVSLSLGSLHKSKRR